jgi:hypothetical protein
VWNTLQEIKNRFTNRLLKTPNQDQEKKLVKLSQRASFKAMQHSLDKKRLESQTGRRKRLAPTGFEPVTWRL